MTTEKIHNLFETSLLEQEFIKQNFSSNPDYTLDNDSNRVWIEIKNPKPSFLKGFDNEYKKFACDFEVWADANELDNPEVLTYESFSLDDYHPNSVTFMVDLS